MTAEHASRRDDTLTRRTLVTAMAVGAGAIAARSGGALAQTQAEKPAAPPTTVTSPPRDFSPHGAPTTYFWDPDVIAVDPSFNQFAQPNTAITRLWTGALWAEGPAWSAQGRYLLWSDIPNNRQLRWLEDDGKVSVLTCRPTEGLTAAGCDAIIADFVARNDPAGATPTSFAPSTSTAAEPGAVPGFMCHGVTAATPSPSVPARTPSAGDPTRFAGLASFLANIDGDPRFIVLGPRSWSCEALVFQDGRDAVIVFDPASPPVTPRDRTAPISIENDYLWHGGIGSVTACAVFDDSALVQFVTRNYPVYLPCPGAGRTVTRVDAHVSTFVDTDGARGAGWIVLPSSQGRDGVVSVLTCRPTAGLTAADCDSIVADWAARANAPRAPG